MKLVNSIVFIFLISIPLLFGQQNNFKTHTQMNLDCKKCHSCDTPTKADPCLVLCPRNQIDIVSHLPEEGPDSIIINEIKNDKDLYKPVNFTHRIHSEMSQMSGGCSICHHFNPPGEIVKCTFCHEVNRVRTDLSIPDIKAAYHRQCINCHDSWEEKTECINCHALNSSEINVVKSNPPMEKAHSKITLPTKIVYDIECDEGNVITYFHDDHINSFGLICIDCHTQESCANCHAKNKPKFKSIDEHIRCSSCHDTEDNCKQCHKDKEAKPFNHLIKTGFSLTEFHAKNECSSCHITKNKFTGLKKDCTTCHYNEEGNFKHSITGVVLDENHFDLACEDCHQNNNYNNKPSCDDCHDEISYPNNLPGKRINSK